MTQLEAPASERQVARLRRSKDERVIAGVCGGLGRYFSVDPVWFRLAFIILAIGGGSGVLFYVIAWIAIPEEGADTLPTQRFRPRNRGPLIAGVILVGVGLLFLADNLAPWFYQFMWPAAVIAAGIGLIYAGSRREHN
ncbi:MAG TPA: PspC domain-containing protein [Acidimicrobiia bacterium]|nr:PspC domain-containing protein [Acidimicrobiia bacterium]